jgi:hypothetical protein
MAGANDVAVVRQGAAFTGGDDVIIAAVEHDRSRAVQCDVTFYNEIGVAFRIRRTDNDCAPIMNIANQRQRGAAIDKDVAAAGDCHILERAVAAYCLHEAATTGFDRAGDDGRLVEVDDAVVASFDRAAGNCCVRQDDRCGAADRGDQAILVVDIGRVDGDGSAVLGFDLAAIAISEIENILEDDLAAVLGEECAAVVGDFDVGAFELYEAAAILRFKSGAGIVRDVERVALCAFERDRAVILGQEEGTPSVIILAVLDGTAVECDSAPVRGDDFAAGPVARFIRESNRPKGNNAAVGFDRAKIRAGVLNIDDEGVLAGRFDRAVVFEAAERQRTCVASRSVIVSELAVASSEGLIVIV